MTRDMGKFPADIFAGQRFAVLGLGRNGLPAAQALAAMGAHVVMWDDQEAARVAAATAAGAGLTLADPAANIAGCTALVLSPGIPHRLPAPHPLAAAAAAAGVPILSDADLLYRAVRASGSAARFVGVTGTNGKSTTTALIAHVLAAGGMPVAAGGNLGPAALSLPWLPDHGAYVIEMSSYMLERIAALRFDAAVMLNLSPDHIDRHGDLAGYAAAKRAIFARQTAADLAVLGVDDAGSRAMAAWRAASPGQMMRVSGTDAPGADIATRAGWLVDAGGRLVDLATARALPGAHNAQNAAAAAAVAGFLGQDRAGMARAIAAFPGLAHRQQRVGAQHGVCFINDSKATNAEATARALACHDRVIWIAGGIAKDGGIADLAPYFPRIAKALLIGRDAPQFAATLAAHGVPHRVVGTLEAAVGLSLAAAQAAGAPAVLLSPAAASFDQFSGFEARGTRFAELVAGLRRGAA